MPAAQCLPRPEIAKPSLHQPTEKTGGQGAAGRTTVTATPPAIREKNSAESQG
jgi:hypothetical protein